MHIKIVGNHFVTVLPPGEAKGAKFDLYQFDSYDGKRARRRGLDTSRYLHSLKTRIFSVGLDKPKRK